MSETASEPATPPAAPKEKGKAVEYLVFMESPDDDGSWLEGPTIKARSPRKAIEGLVEKFREQGSEDAPAKFVAVPKRYWIVEEPGVETQTRIVWK